MALTTYTAATDIIKTLGTNPEDRPTLTDDTFKAKFDENAANIAAFLNAMIAELASTANGKGASQIGIEDSGSKFTATTVEAALAEAATLISTLTTETTHQSGYATRDISAAGVQSITGLSFAAKKVTFQVCINSTEIMSIGVSLGTSAHRATSQISTGAMSANSSNSIMLVGANWTVVGKITSVTATGFDITWSIDSGTPTGTAQIIWTADRW